MPLYVADYLRDTRHLNAAEHGAYLLLIMQYWTAGSLPADDARLARIACMTEAEWKAAKPIIKELFEPNWRHKRIEDELIKSAEKYDRRSDAGKRGGNEKQRRLRSPSKTVALLEQNPSNATPSDLANDHEKPPDESGNALASSSQPQPQLRDRIGDARAQSAFTDASKALATAFWKALGFEHPIEIPPEFAGVDWRAVEWERAGWTIDLIDVEARKVARDKPLKPLSYFEKVFATSFAKRQAPLPVVEVREAEKLTVIHGKTQSRSGSLIDTINRKLADLEDEKDDDPALPEGPVLRLPN